MRISVHDDPVLKVYMQAMGVKSLSHVEVPDAELEKAVIQAKKQHPEENDEQHRARAVARLAFKKHGSVKQATPNSEFPVTRTELVWFAAASIGLEIVTLAGLILFHLH